MFPHVCVKYRKKVTSCRFYFILLSNIKKPNSERPTSRFHFWTVPFFWVFQKLSTTFQYSISSRHLFPKDCNQSEIEKNSFLNPNLLVVWNHAFLQILLRQGGEVRKWDGWVLKEHQSVKNPCFFHKSSSSLFQIESHSTITQFCYLLEASYTKAWKFSFPSD